MEQDLDAKKSEALGLISLGVTTLVLFFGALAALL